MTGPFFLGLDVSTTATKALLMDARGQVVQTASTPYGYDTPQPLHCEQDPALWWDGAVRSIRAVLDASGIAADAVAGIGLTGQMHGLVLLDVDGAVLRPAILWNDGRTGTECDAIRSLLGRERLIALTGNDALTGFTAPKLLWVRQHEPEVYRRIAHVLLPKDYVRYRLTSRFATDKAGAAGTLLLDLQTRDWSDEVVRTLEIDSAWLPPTHEGTEQTGAVTDEAARATALAAGTPVVAGGGDQAAAAVGTGAVDPGIVSLSLGTSGVVFASTSAPVVEPNGRLHAFCHAAPDRWHVMGVMLSAAGSLRWYRDTLAPETPYDALLAPAADVSPGSDGLFFMPYLTGERTPHADPHARGGFVGLTVRHTRAHMTRAVLEGVAFGLRDSLTLMRDAGLAAPQEIRLTGGGAQSPVWRQILADVLNVDLVELSTTEGAAYGAALLAAVRAGVWPDVPTACQDVVAPAGRTRPDPDRAARYHMLYPHYRMLYPALAPLFLATADNAAPEDT